MTRLTPALRAYLCAIDTLTAREGVPPTIIEIGDEIGVRSKNGIHQMLVRASKLGLVTWRPGLCRTLRLTTAGAVAAREAA